MSEENGVVNQSREAPTPSQPKRGGRAPLTDVADELGFPATFAARSVTKTPAVESALTWLIEQRPRSQNSWPALLLALIAQVEELLALEGKASDADVFTSYPPEESVDGGRVVNTLNFTRSAGESVRLRAYYNRALSVIRNRMLRQHPSNPGHATQSWRGYRTLIATIGALSPEERRAVAEGVWKVGVLDMPERQIATVKERAVRPFEHVVGHMPTQVAGIRGGALLQGLAFGYLRADSPNLILESHSVNTGSSRAGMLGDVDGFRGQEPELAAEVKDVDLTVDNTENLISDFFEDIVDAPNATAVVVCRSITDVARTLIESRGVTVLSRMDLVRIVGVWDMPKQQEALRGVEYYLGRIQKSDAAVAYLRSWLVQEDVDAGLGGIAVTTTGDAT